MTTRTETTTEAAVLVAPEKIEVQTFPLPAIDDETGILRVEVAGVCTGSDVKLYRGKRDNPFPLIPGHETVGVIEQIGPILAETNEVEVGDRVILRGSHCGHCKACRSGNDRFCAKNVRYGVYTSSSVPPGLWGGYARHVFLAPGAMLQKVPPRVTAEQAVMAGIFANGIYWGQKIGGVELGTSLVVQGVGPQGLSAVMAAHQAGAHPIVAVGLSNDRRRLELAKEFGADQTVMADRESVSEAVSRVTKSEMADVVLDVTGSGKSFQTALDLLRSGGTLVQCSLTGSGVATPVLLDDIVMRQIRVQGIYSKPVEIVSEALELLETGRMPVEKIISHRFPLREAEQALQLVEKGGDATKAVLLPNG